MIECGEEAGGGGEDAEGAGEAGDGRAIDGDVRFGDERCEGGVGGELVGDVV